MNIDSPKQPRRTPKKRTTQNDSNQRAAASKKQSAIPEQPATTVEHSEFTHGRRKKFMRRAIKIIFVLTVLWTTLAYGVARWYQHAERNQRVQLGASYSFPMAREYGYDPKVGYLAVIQDLGIKHLRVMSYWNEIEKEPNQYDFDDLDFQFREAEKHNVSLTLALGVRQPRWPECHEPEWAKNLEYQEWTAELNSFIDTVVRRYKDSSALKNYQLENEYFMKSFGHCTDFSRERYVKEFETVKAADSSRPIVLSRSNNVVGIPVRAPHADISGISIYKRVHESTVTNWYIEYPFPAWHYSALAGFTKLLTGKPAIVHELQAEPWGPMPVVDMSIEEQDKSMSPKTLRDRITYSLASGIKSSDLWGAEWWYWRKTHWQDDQLWNIVKTAVERCDGQISSRDECMRD